MSTSTSYGASEHSQSVQTYLRWLKGNPSKELKTVVMIATRLYKPPMQLEDLISEGNLGLLMALNDCQTKEIPGPINKYIARKIRYHIIEFIRIHHTDCLINHERVDFENMDLLPCIDKNADKQLEIMEEGQAFIGVINSVKSNDQERDVNIFKMIYGIECIIPFSFDEAGKVYSISEEKARRISDKALGRVMRTLRYRKYYNDSNTQVRGKFISLNGIKWALNSYYH